MSDDTDVSSIVAELLGLQPSPATTKPRIRSADTYGDPVDSWVWPGYIPRGVLTLVDAGASSGKTRTFLAIAAAGSRGLFPFGFDEEPCEVKPFSTVYLGREDAAERIIRVFKQSGGDLSRFFFWNERELGRLIFDYEGKGADQLAEVISELNAQGHNVGLVGADPIAAYGPSGFNINDTVKVNGMLIPLAEMAAKVDVGMVMIRHKRKPQAGAKSDFEDEGAGAMTWRNTSRAHWQVIPRKDNTPTRFEALVISLRNAIDVVYSKAFALCIHEGRIFYKKFSDLDGQFYVDQDPRLIQYFQGYVPTPAHGDRGPSPEAVHRAKEAVADFLIRQPGKSGKAKDVLAALANTHARRTVYRAKDSLIADGLLTSVGSNWVLTNEYDPFADDQDSTPPPSWADLD